MSCRWEGKLERAAWEVNSKRTLIIEQYIPTPKILKENEKIRKNETKHSKKDRISQELILTGENLKTRVWSWLRMNAGGVLNTCKSNGEMKRKFSDGSFIS